MRTAAMPDSATDWAGIASPRGRLVLGSPAETAAPLGTMRRSNAEEG
jgi:hypothetical protein